MTNPESNPAISLPLLLGLARSTGCGGSGSSSSIGAAKRRKKTNQSFSLNEIKVCAPRLALYGIVLLTIVIGQYALQYQVKDAKDSKLTNFVNPAQQMEYCALVNEGAGL